MQLSRKAPTYANIQKVVLRDNEASSDFGSDNEASSEAIPGNCNVSRPFASLKVTIVIVITLLCFFGMNTLAFYATAIHDVPNFQRSPLIDRLAHFALNEFNKQQNVQLSFSKVVRVREKMVAWMAYYLTVQAVDGHQTTRLSLAKIWVVTWKHFTQLEDFKPLDADKGGGQIFYKDSDEAKVRAKRKQFWEKALDIKELCGPGDVWWGVRGKMRDNFNHSFDMISHDEHFENSKFVDSVLDLYWEVPPVAGPSLTHQTRYDPTHSFEPVIPDYQKDLFRQFGLSNPNNTVFNGYTQMVYVKISDSSQH